MLKETITFDDFNDQEQTKEFYFNLSRAEFAKLELGFRGGIENYLKQVIDEGNGRKILEFFEVVIKDSYGARSADGTEFLKTEEVFQRFTASGAYDAMLEKVLDNPDYALTFIRGILPAKYQDAVRQKEAELAANGFRPGAQTLPQSEIDKRAAAAQTPEPAVSQVPEAATPEVAAPEETVTYANSAPALNIQAPTIEDNVLKPGEPGYEQGLTRHQAKELGLL